jgi:ankyrin repeat protein
MASTDFVLDGMGRTKDMSSKSPLLGLPTELFLEIAPHIESFKDLNSLVRTSRFFHGMFNTDLYRRAVVADDAVLDDIVGWVLLRCRLASLTLLLDHGLSVNHTGNFGAYQCKETMLHFLSKLGDRKRLVSLARIRVQPDADTKAKDAYLDTVTYGEIDHSNCELAALLLARGADPNAVNQRGYTPLHLASDWAGDDPEMIHLLIAWGADIEARSAAGDTPLLLTASGGRHPAMVALLEHGADAGARNECGETPLHWASSLFGSEHHGLAKSLLEHGAIVNSTDEGGRAPLHWVFGSHDSHLDKDRFMARFLLENGADVNPTSNYGLSPLHCALKIGCGMDVIALLLEHGAVVNATDMSGSTPLHWLLGSHQRDDLVLTRFILENGADVNAISNDGCSILQHALLVGCGAHVVALLLEHGADVSVLDRDERRLLSQMSWAYRGVINFGHDL